MSLSFGGKMSAGDFGLVGGAKMYRSDAENSLPEGAHKSKVEYSPQTYLFFLL